MPDEITESSEEEGTDAILCTRK
ncbi:hypothetical protein CL3_14540 [butyrate-producing bacterium SM4/1]|nr:hypothetical protein CLS_34910 [[Clostridium] cf. saccharolyticum K10]CBL36117.1 hypothetical protein CL3_14540 [butyrate-producing bacterium SM4/1]